MSIEISKLLFVNFILIKNCRDILGRERIGGIGDKQTRFPLKFRLV
jgi:hypothetical protein